MAAGSSTRRDFLKWTGMGACAALAGVGLGDLTANAVETRRQELLLPKWDADGFRVGLIADTHNQTPVSMRRASTALQWLIDQKPDAIVFAGDYLNGTSHEQLALFKQSLEPLSGAQCPVLGVLGNHDYDSGQPQKVVKVATSMGMRVLINECVDVGGVGIAGIDDALFGNYRPDVLLGSRLPYSLISLLHEPDYVVDTPKAVSLQLSGHSHGGQICLPGGFALHAPYGGRNYIAGFYPDARAPLFVSRGVGTSGPDMRLFCRPEVTILTLRSA